MPVDDGKRSANAGSVVCPLAQKIAASEPSNRSDYNSSSQDGLHAFFWAALASGYALNSSPQLSQVTESKSDMVRVIVRSRTRKDTGF